MKCHYSKYLRTCFEVAGLLSGCHLKRLAVFAGLGVLLLFVGAADNKVAAQSCNSFTLIAANFSANNVTRYNTDGTYLNTPISGTANVSAPNSLLLYRDTLYVASSGYANDDIKKFNPRTGALYGTFASNFNFPEKMIIGPDGNMFVADFANNAVKRLNINNGALLSTFTMGTAGQQPIGIEFVGSDMYVTRGTISNGTGQAGRIERYTMTNNFSTATLAQTITFTSATPRGITLGPDGNLYIIVYANSGTGVAQIEELVPGAASTSLFVTMDTGSVPYQGISWSPDGFLYVADFGENEIQVYNSSGVEQTTKRIATNLSGPHYVQFYCPCAAQATLVPSSLTLCSGSSAPVSITTTGTNPQIWYTFATGSPNATISGPTTTTASSNTITLTSTVTTTFSVTAVDRIGCSASVTGNVTVRALPTATLTLSNSGTVCLGQPLGLTATGGTSYTLLPGGLTNTSGVFSVTPTSTTTYTAVVSNAAGCTATAQRTATVNPVPNGTATGGVVSCTTPATVTGSSNLAASSYSWTGPGGFTSSAQSFTTNTPGTYTLVVTANGCTSTSPATAVVTQNVTAPQNVSATNTGPLNCTSTSAAVSVTTSTTGVSYRWSSGQTTASFVATTAGTYSVTVTSANGCSAVASTVLAQDITPPAGVTASSTGPITCAQPTVSVSATSTTAGVSYRWSGPNSFTSNAQSFTTATAGTYSVTVTAPNGCTALTTTSLTSNTTAPALTLTSATVCAGQTATLTATAGLSSYVFSPGLTQVGGSSGNTASVVGSGSGTTVYSVTVTNAVGCTAVATGSVTVNPNPVITLTSATVCAGQTATLTATAGYASYVFSSGLTQVGSSNVATATTAGTYSVTATSSAGCSSTATGSVTVNPNPVPSATSGTVTCAGPATVTGSSNLAASSYAWTGPGGFTSSAQSFTTNVAGSYTLVVTANGCSSTAVTTTVSQDTAPPQNVSATNTGPLTCANPSVTVSASTSTTGVSYRWSSGQTTASFSTTATGTYSVTVTSANGCTATTSTTVSQNTTTPVVSATNTGPLTCANPSVTVSASTTTAGASYKWNNGQTTASFPATTAGAYSVTVTAPNGCTVLAGTTVSQDITVPQNVAATSTGPLTCTNTTVSVSVNTTTAGVSYRWSGPNSFTSNAQSFTTATSGLYSVTVTSTASGCTTATSTSVAQDITLPVISATGGQIGCQAPSIQLAASSTPSGVTYRWTGPAGFTSTAQNPAASVVGTYTVTVTNTANGCAVTDTAIVSKQACARLGDLVFEDTNANGLQDTGEPGINGVSVQLYLNGSATPIASTTTNSSGIYSFTGLTPGNSFSYVVGFSLPTGYTATTANQNANASDALDSDADVVTGKTGNYTLAAGETNNTVDAGFYRPAALGDRVFADANRNGVQDGGELGIGGVSVQLYTGTNTLVASTTTNSSGIYSFTGLTPGVAYSVVFGTPAGYTAVAADQGGNDALDSDANPATGRTGSYTLASNETNNTVDAGFSCIAPTVSATGGLLTCANSAVQLKATSSLSPSTYQWTGPGGFTSSLQNPTTTAPGTYTVVVTSNAGCSATAVTTATVTQDSTIPIVSATNTGPLTCAVPTVTVSASTTATGASYRWSNGLTTASFSTTASGTYSVTVTSANGCTATASTEVIYNGVSAVFGQGICNGKGTNSTAADDFYTLSISATAAGPGASNRYEVVLNANADGTGGTVLNAGGTPYGQSVTVGGAGIFKADGTSTYTLTIRDINNTLCRYRQITSPVASCSSCQPTLCPKVSILKR